jgi:hypothetical protein
VTSQKPGASGSWIDQSVFALDRWLRRRQGIFEYTNRADCLFRVQLCCTEQHLSLPDGTRVRAGETLLKLHLWNEHIPPMGQSGATFGWARRMSRSVDHSLRELAYYLARHPELASVRVLGGDMRLGDIKQRTQFVHIARRYGFAPADLQAVIWREAIHRIGDTLHRVGDTLLIVLLVLATNPIALRRAPLRHIPSRVFMSRSALLARYRLGLTPTRAVPTKPKLTTAPLPQFGKSSS